MELTCDFDAPNRMWVACLKDDKGIAFVKSFNPGLGPVLDTIYFRCFRDHTNIILEWMTPKRIKLIGVWNGEDGEQREIIREMEAE